MKDYIYQFYNEGLGYLLIVKPQQFINKYVKNKSFAKVLMWIIKGLYTCLAFLLIVIIMIKKWPF